VSTTITCPAGATTTLYTSADTYEGIAWAYYATGNSGALHRAGEYTTATGSVTVDKHLTASVGTTSDLVMSSEYSGGCIVWKATTTSYSWDVTFTEISNYDTAAASAWTSVAAAAGATTTIYSEDINKDGAYHFAYRAASSDGDLLYGEILFSWDDSAGTVSSPLINNYALNGSAADLVFSADMTASLGTLRLRAATTSYDWTVLYKKIASL
jgi:hypothetical protein